MLKTYRTCNPTLYIYIYIYSILNHLSFGVGIYTPFLFFKKLGRPRVLGLPSLFGMMMDFMRRLELLYTDVIEVGQSSIPHQWFYLVCGMLDLKSCTLANKLKKRLNVKIDENFHDLVHNKKIREIHLIGGLWSQNFLAWLPFISASE